MTNKFKPSDSMTEMDAEWQRRVVVGTLATLKEAKPAKMLCGQLKEKIKAAHETFNLALDKMEARHSARSACAVVVGAATWRTGKLFRLVETEEQRLRLRKKQAPRLARLAMESLATRDVLNYGMNRCLAKSNHFYSRAGAT